MCVCVLFELRQIVVVFYSGNCLRISKFCVDLCKKHLIARDVLRFQFLSTILTEIPSGQNERKRFGFLKEEQNSVVIHR